MAQNADSEGRLITFVRIGISAVVVGSTLFVILSRDFPDEHNWWAFSLLGIVIGYWLR